MKLPTASWHDPRVLVGNKSHDDAGVFALTPEMALVQTIDFFTPVVDDARIFGQIAATNSLSDIYAMGGVPMTALNLLAVPAGGLDPDTVSNILAGGQEVMSEAHTSVIGGHTIDDPEPKMGYAVTGMVHPDHVWRNDTAQPGDVLYLSKAIGTGVLVKAIKDGVVDQDGYQAAVAMMTTSNLAARNAISKAVVDPSACTDVTGFGLLGHLWEMAEGSGVTMMVRQKDVPLLSGALALAEANRFPSGSRRNWEFVQPHIALAGAAGPQQWLLADAVTSGGLLFTIPEANKDAIRQAFDQAHLSLWEIGAVLDGPAKIRLVP